MSASRDTLHAFLLSDVELLAERHASGPNDNFEYRLWDDLHGKIDECTLVDAEEAKELMFLVINTDTWVISNLETGMFQLIDIEAWHLLLNKREH